MMNFIRRKQGSRGLSERGDLGVRRGSIRRQPPCWSGMVELLESRELLSTVQDFSGAAGLTAYTLQQLGGPPAAQVQGGGLFGNYLRLATTPTAAGLGNDNSISFDTSDPGGFYQVNALWIFSVTPTTGLGSGLSFALLNTSVYGTSGGAASPNPAEGLYSGSLAFGFDTTNDVANLSLNGAVVSSSDLTGKLALASVVPIEAQATIDFQAKTVSLTLTPYLGSPVTVFNATSVPGMVPYQSRVGLEAQNSAISAANFDLDYVNVAYTNTFTSGVIEFSSPTYTAQENQGSVQITVMRIGGTVGSFTVYFVAADGTAQNGVNYTSVSGALTFPDIRGAGSTGQDTQTIVIPIIDDHVYDGDKTVNLYLSNPTLTAPMGSLIQATLTIQNTDAPPPTVSPTVTKIYVPGTRRVSAIFLTFSQPMNLTSAANVNNYVVSMPPARRGGKPRPVPISRAVVDPSGLYVTLYRANVRAHLTRFVQIIVRGKPATGLISQSGTFLAGSNGVSGTDATLVVTG